MLFVQVQVLSQLTLLAIELLLFSDNPEEKRGHEHSYQAQGRG